MDTTDWYNVGTCGMILGGFFTLLDTGILDPLIQYRYDTFNLLQFILFALVGGLCAVGAVQLITKLTTFKELWSQGKRVYQTLSGKTDTEMDRMINDASGNLKQNLIGKVKQTYQHGMKKLQSRIPPQTNENVKTVNVTKVIFPTPAQLWQEVTQQLTTNILATNVEAVGIADQPLSILQAELDTPEGLEPLGNYQKRAMVMFFTIAGIMMGVNLVVRYFPAIII